MFSSLHFRRKTTTVQLFLGLAFLVLLSGCEENKIGATKNPVQPNIVSNSNSESGTISVSEIAQTPVQQNTHPISQSGTESLSGSEMINGILVPPEPSPELNNATLAGVDVNNNGVRDDVERKMATLIDSPQAMAKAIAIAVFYQKLITQTGSLSRENQILLEKELSCSLSMPGNIPIQLIDSNAGTSIEDLMVNNTNRKSKIRDHYDVIG